jgi:hypothetical protein
LIRTTNIPETGSSDLHHSLSEPSYFVEPVVDYMPRPEIYQGEKLAKGGTILQKRQEDQRRT